jgi:hypothetical protein
MRERRKWLARLIIALDLLANCAVMVWEEASLMHKIVQQAGPTGHFAVISLAVVAFMALTDVVVNDLLPDRYRLCYAIEHRHTIYALLSLGALSISFVVVKTHGVTPLLLHYGLVAGFALTIALFDIHDRVRERHR